MSSRVPQAHPEQGAPSTSQQTKFVIQKKAAALTIGGCPKLSKTTPS